MPGARPDNARESGAILAQRPPPGPPALRAFPAILARLGLITGSPPSMLVTMRRGTFHWKMLTRGLRISPRAPWRALAPPMVSALAVLALLFATVAHAGHLHPSDGTPLGAHQELCGLCLHIERLGTPPAVVLLAALLLVAVATLPGSMLPLPSRSAPRAYRARAPPARFR